MKATDKIKELDELTSYYFNIQKWLMILPESAKGNKDFEPRIKELETIKARIKELIEGLEIL